MKKGFSFGPVKVNGKAGDEQGKTVTIYLIRKPLFLYFASTVAVKKIPDTPQSFFKKQKGIITFGKGKDRLKPVCMDEINIDREFLEQLRKNAPEAFENLYAKYFRMVETLVLKMNGSREDARDIFQETLVVFVKKIRDPDFTLSGKISTFLYAVSRNIYLKRSGKNQPEFSMDQQKLSNMDLVEKYTGELSPTEKEAMFNAVSQKMEELEDDCRAIIMYAFYQNLTHSQIAELTGYAVSFIKVKKFRCLEYLRRKVRETDIFKNA